MALPSQHSPKRALPQNAGAKQAEGLSSNLGAQGPDQRHTITMEPSQLPLRRGNKAQLVPHSHQLILIDTTLRSESSTPSQFTFLLNHTGKLGALLLLSDPTGALCSPTVHRVGKHPSSSGSTVPSHPKAALFALPGTKSGWALREGNQIPRGELCQLEMLLPREGGLGAFLDTQ